MAKIVPLDLLTPVELRHLVGKSADGLTTDQINSIVAGLIQQRNNEGLRHELAQAWEQGRSDEIMTRTYPWINAHLVNPYDIPEGEITVSDDGQPA
jgi:hypothetical protein